MDAGDYGLLCDVIERAWQQLPVEPEEDERWMLTSSYARAGANRIMRELGLTIDDFDD